MTINGQPLSLTQTYTVATNDYMLGGGDGYTAPAGGQVIITPNGGPLPATVVLDAIQKAGTITSVTDGRISEEQ